jgi:two-component system, NtrC family, response regulator HydG
VDDEPDTCANLADILMDQGYQVDTAQDGFEALDLVRERAYDVALLDLRMPGMDGLELYRRIREISAGTVAIVVTAYASSDTAQSILTAGAWQIIPKPADIPKLLGMIGEVAENPLVLVVDDDHELCQNLWDLFRERGYRVHLAHDVPDAQRSLSRHAFDVVLLDMKLPAGNGYEVLNTIQQTNREARTLLITGHRAETEEHVQRALEEGAKAVCYKPFDVDALLATMQQLAQQKPPGK